MGRSAGFIRGLGIFVEFPLLTEQRGLRHDLDTRTRGLPSKFGGVETVDVGTLPRRVRREKPDITSLETKKTFPADFIIFPQVSRTTARADEATSLVRETCTKVGDLKGKAPCSIVRLRVLVKKHKPA